MCEIQLWERDNDNYVLSDTPMWILHSTFTRSLTHVCTCMLCVHLSDSSTYVVCNVDVYLGA